jgi:glycogen operon protein
MEMMERIDTYPTHMFNTFGMRPGRPYPFGATPVPGGVNFSVFSRHADYCVLVLFKKGAEQPYAEIPFRGMFTRPGSGEPFWGDFRIGNVFSMVVFNLNYEEIEYGFRMGAPYPKVERGKPGFHRFDSRQVLLDPYARAIGGRDTWGQLPDWNQQFQHRGRIVYDDFDWESDRPLEIPAEELVVYEMHVRGFTRDESSGVRYAGTFAAMRDKIPYLKELGVNAVELLPIYEFDELEGVHNHPDTGEMLVNYWGYSTVGFFAPKAAYAATGKTKDGTMVVDELKTLVKDLHANGIEVLLDVVFNHTAEGNEYGPTISFRGIDNVTYYMLSPEGYYFNFSGTGNTLNCNNPVVRGMVLDCLRYWASEYHIDGFRFDLAAILGRDQSGAPMANPPLLEALAADPVLAKCKLIAEAWDAGGLYQVGSFPAFGRWAEWNGKYRDTLRRWLKGDGGLTSDLALRLQGSPDLYASRGPTASVNFITCHDGFSLMDMVSYNTKHNEANGENNNDGANDNNSWNCGWEGDTDDPGINQLRKRQVKNALALLMVSQGVPMIYMGDEVGKSQSGNNNVYCHDNQLSWLDWNLLQNNADLLRFASRLIAFRKAHILFHNRWHLRGQDYLGTGYPDISWHGERAWQPDWSEGSRLLAFMLDGKHAWGGTKQDDSIYVVSNTHWEGHDVELPGLPEGLRWHVFANTGANESEDAWDLGSEPQLSDQSRLFVGPRSVVILLAK